MGKDLYHDWLQRIGHHFSVRLEDGRAVSGFLLNVQGNTLEIRESPPGDWNSLGGDHVRCTFEDIRTAFDNSMEEMMGIPERP